MSDTTPSFDFDQMDAVLTELGRNGHTAHAILAASNIESLLEDLLRSKMPGASKNLLAQLFSTRYGPLSTLSAKIDILRALGELDDDISHDLHVFRKIRNEFAHATNRHHFDDDAVKALLQQFKGYDPRMDRLAFFSMKVRDAISGLTSRFQNALLVNAISGYRESRKTSPEKSS